MRLLIIWVDEKKDPLIMNISTMLTLSLTLHDFALGVSSMAACYVQKSAASVIVDSSL